AHEDVADPAGRRRCDHSDGLRRIVLRRGRRAERQRRKQHCETIRASHLGVLPTTCFENFFPQCSSVQQAARRRDAAMPRDADAQPPGALKTAFTMPLALPKSILPVCACLSAAMTLPMSLMLVAPVALTASAIAASASASDIWRGRNALMISISPRSCPASSLRPALS